LADAEFADAVDQCPVDWIATGAGDALPAAFEPDRYAGIGNAVAPAG
jgi:hypothetical protein